MSILELAERATRADGVAPFNEAALFALRDGARARVLVQQSDRDGAIVAAAYATGDAPVEIVVDPERRRAGIGRRILDELLADGEDRFWAHGNLPAAQALAASAGLVVGRELLVLRLVFDGPPAPERTIEGVTLRTYRDEDADAIVRVNARAFAHHPEQGAMDRADLDRRMASDWFDPDGLFVAERDGRVIGFHWTKIEDTPEEGPVGEVYVVGIDPDAQGGGLGTALTARGLRHMYERGIPVVDLYVEGDNAPALKVYRNLGFQDWKIDTLYKTP
ncbi:mycothiol synthase [Aeromicrobium wangtongii]|uniref:Mycothiol acetyltransferase n=1 Tax=Aeromicrobium wangtongii TaxID=2969247 RepID=A0ABY5MAZ9_9ACTN|nr:mycothiol synthase [Aeromicrobium wangtongii]MCD9196660.1 mycothiol synthase [Aeromicrobium wangtongii]UUP14170.1 mycothiol synthase [Aeromicrobium wangtongii]